MTIEEYDNIIMCLMLAISDKERQTKEHVMETLFISAAILAFSLGCPNGESFATFARKAFEATSERAVKELEIRQLNKMMNPD